MAADIWRRSGAMKLLVLLHLLSVAVIQVCCQTNATEVKKVMTTPTQPKVTTATQPSIQSNVTTATQPSTQSKLTTTKSTPPWSIPNVVTTTSTTPTPTSKDGSSTPTDKVTVPVDPVRVRANVTLVDPQYGPVAGGTRVRITVRDLNTSAVTAVHFGSYKNTGSIEVVSKSALAAITAPVNSTQGNLSIALEINDQSMDSGFMFEYRPNPTLKDIQPRDHLLAGGTVVTVYGTNFYSVAKPRMIIRVDVTGGPNGSYTNNFYSAPCEVNGTNGDKLKCRVPGIVLPPEIARQLNDSLYKYNSSLGPGVAVFYTTDGRQRADVFIGLQLDGFKRYENINDVFPDIKFTFHLQPTINCSFDRLDFDPNKDKVISLEGHGLTRASGMNDFRITIGDANCVVSSLNNSQVDCKPPKTKPTKAAYDKCAADTMSLQVMVGNAEHQCSCVRYVDSRRLNLGLVIGLSIALGLITLAVIFITFVIVERKNRNRQQQNNKKLVEPEDKNL